MPAVLSFDLVFGNRHPFLWLGSPFTTLLRWNSLPTSFKVPGRVTVLSPQECRLLLVANLCALLNGWSGCPLGFVPWRPQNCHPLHWDLDARPLRWTTGVLQAILPLLMGVFTGFCELLSLSPLWDPVISHFSHSTPFSPRRLEDSFILLCRGSLRPHCVPPNMLGTPKENHILFLFWYRNAKLGGGEGNIPRGRRR